jgi:hypothetical protein
VTFQLDGTLLLADYDEEADILYLWTEPGPRPAISFEDDSGHLVQLDPDTREFIGLAIVDFELRWANKPQIVVGVPRIERRVLEPVG